MKLVEIAKKSVSYSLIKKSEISAVKSANSACLSWQHQPKESEKIKKLRKF